MTDNIALTVRGKVTVDWWQDKMLRGDHVFITFAGLSGDYYKIMNFCVTSPPKGRECPECSTILHDVEAEVVLEKEMP